MTNVKIEFFRMVKLRIYKQNKFIMMHDYNADD